MAGSSPVSTGCRSDAKGQLVLSSLSRSLLRIDRQFPIIIKVGLPLVIVIATTLILYTRAALGDVRQRLNDAFATHARQLGNALGAELVHSQDSTAVSAFLTNLVQADPSTRLIRIYRLTGNSTSVWASSSPADVGAYQPGLHDLAPTRSGLTSQEDEVVGGERVLETVQPLIVNGEVFGSVGIYTSVKERDDAIAGATRKILIFGTGGAASSLLCIGLVTYLLVLRRVFRLSRASARIGAGDLTTRLPEGDERPGRDELANIARQFDHMIRRLSDLQADMERQAVTDSLTGLHNRHHLETKLQAAIEKATASGEPVTVLVGDLDRFKSVNDTFGHAAGDRILCEVGDAILKMEGPGWMAWRFGGDEFAIAVLDTPRDEAEFHTARLAQTIHELEVEVADGVVIRPSMSMGLATYPEDGTSAEELLRVADQRMYSAKAVLSDRRQRRAQPKIA